ncbi:MAG: hypothetical protein R3Y11_08110 [Pseudomonadota bacterium]
MLNEIHNLQDMMLVESIVDAINRHARMRLDDVAIVILAFFSLIATIIFALIAYKLNEKQKEIAEAQKNISVEQTKISEKQVEIMDQQNRIALFDKRYDLFISINRIVFSVDIFLKEINRAQNSGELPAKEEHYKGMLFCVFFNQNQGELFFKHFLEDRASLNTIKVKDKLIQETTRLCSDIERVNLIFKLDKEDERQLFTIGSLLLKAMYNYRYSESFSNFVNIATELAQVCQNSQLQKTLAVQIKLYTFKD